EELHIKLVVFHDQDGLWHSIPALFRYPCCGHGRHVGANVLRKGKFCRFSTCLARRSGLVFKITARNHFDVIEFWHSWLSPNSGDGPKRRPHLPPHSPQGSSPT